MTQHALMTLTLTAVLASVLHASDEDLALLEEQALQAAAQRVALSVVQIRTVGGLDRVGNTLIAQGPTTGLVVSADGYIVSSAFNFAQQPNSILVRLPSGEQAPATMVARDKSRMLVLLKVESATPLPVPEAAPTEEIRVGQWAVAVGRTFRADRVDVSVGIVSALGRMYGRVLQTDANVSVANYGGPLLDVHGRVLGVLVPMSPQSIGQQSEVAGAEFYDSGIGFAVSLEHVLQVLERWKQGEDLLPGKLGVGLKGGQAYIEPPQITTVWQRSPADTAGWQAGDVIIAVDGTDVETQAQLRFLLAPRYAGDQLSVTIRRGEQWIESEVTLAGKLAPYRHAFLGVLPVREKPAEDAPGVLVRSVWPKSPAELAGVEPGNRITKIGKSEIGTVKEALTALDGLQHDEPVEIIVTRDDHQITLQATLTTLPEDILSRERLPAANSPQQKQDSAELKPLKLLEFVQIASYYAPTQDQKRPLGLLLWLAGSDPDGDGQLLQAWQEICHRDGLMLLIAHPQDQAGWSAGDRDYLNILLRTAKNRFDIDPRRTVVCGRGKAGQLAFTLAFRRGNELSGAIGIDAPLPRTLRLPANLPSSRLAVLAVETPNSSFVPLIRKNMEDLRTAGYPTSWLQRPLAESDRHQLDPQTRQSIARWIDGLDRF